MSELDVKTIGAKIVYLQEAIESLEKAEEELTNTKISLLDSLAQLKLLQGQYNRDVRLIKTACGKLQTTPTNDRPAS